MHRFRLPLLILLWSVAYSWFWSCQRKPYCLGEMTLANTTNMVVTSPPTADIVKVVSAEEQILFTTLDVYFNVNQSSIKKTAEVENFISKAKKHENCI